MSEFVLTGRHVAGITVSAFAVIIGVNFLLAYQAVHTFPGLEVANSYVASQTFDAERAAQQALGWTVRADDDAGQMRLSIRDRSGAPVMVASLSAILGRATSVAQDRTPEFIFDGQDYVAETGEMPPGNWNLRLKATAMDGTAFHQRIVLHIKGRN